MNTDKLLVLPFIAYIRRYWLLLLFFCVALILALNDSVFNTLGSLIYLPVLGTGTWLVVLLIRHLFFRNSLDAYVDNRVPGALFQDDFMSLDKKDRVLLTLATTVGMFIGLCLIAAQLWN